MILVASGAYALVRGLEDFIVGIWTIVGVLWDFIGLRYYGPIAKMVVFSMIIAACFLIVALIAQDHYRKYVIASYVVAIVTLLVARIVAWVRPSNLLASSGQVTRATTEDWPLMLWGIIAIIVILALMVLPYILGKVSGIGFFSMMAMLIFLIVAAVVDIVLFSWPASVLSGLLVALAVIFWFVVYTIKNRLREPGIRPPGVR